MSYDYSNEINELLDNGWSYEEAEEWCKFVCGEDIVEDESHKITVSIE